MQCDERYLPTFVLQVPEVLTSQPRNTRKTRKEKRKHGDHRRSILKAGAHDSVAVLFEDNLRHINAPFRVFRVFRGQLTLPW